MRWSRAFIPTLKETPAEAEIASHQLMLRAGLIRKLSAGAYTYLPLGFRSLLKTIEIIREEMNATGAQEILMPAIQPAELWEESGRMKDFGPLLMQFKDRAGRHTVLGPTHEEVVTDLVRRHVNSYRQLPLILYQIQTKFRDEIRPRFGVLRSREFLMKDAYSFDVDAEELNKSYEAMYRAYCRIFTRCGLDFVVVEAESGPIGGDVSHEFMVPSDAGEDMLVQCTSCSYAANTERAEVGISDLIRSAIQKPPDSQTAPPLQRVHTPGRTTIEQVSEFLGCTPQEMIKTLIYVADGKPVAVLIRGDHEANEAKIRRFLGAAELVMADPDTVKAVTGAPVGFAGPVGLSCRIVADYSVALVTRGVTGANESDHHLVNVVPGRDFPWPEFADLRIATDGDPCPRCGHPLRLRRGIEVGHVFKLGTKYSEAMGAYFLDAQEQRRPFVMGCYGIGVNRILAARIETHHDSDGIVWSTAIAPFQVIVLPVTMQNEDVVAVAESLYGAPRDHGVDVLLDDRDVRAGVKFKDADLVGIPLRVAVGERGLRENAVELKWRWEGEARKVPVKEAVDRIRQALDEQEHAAREQLKRVGPPIVR